MGRGIRVRHTMVLKRRASTDGTPMSMVVCKRFWFIPRVDGGLGRCRDMLVGGVGQLGIGICQPATGYRLLRRGVYVGPI